MKKKSTIILILLFTYSFASAQVMKSMDNKRNSIPIPKANLDSIKTIVNNTPPSTIRYDLYIADTIVTFGKKSKRAIAVNGQIPMPTLTFTEGDTAEIYVHNNLNEETSLHWHGLFLPNQYDGVPNLTQMPIKPHTTHLYKFPIIQHGTHWYHSHLWVSGANWYVWNVHHEQKKRMGHPNDTGCNK